jgi:hypothetical protein
MAAGLWGAKMRAESARKQSVPLRALALNPKYVGAVAFQRTGEPDTGEFEDAEVIGEVRRDAE